MMIWGQPGKLCMFKEKFKTKCFHMSYTYHIHHRLSYISPITIIVLKISFSLLFAKINYESHNISHWMCQIHHVKPLHGNKGDFYLRGYFWLIILIFKYVKKLKQENVYRNVIQPQFWTILKEIIVFYTAETQRMRQGKSCFGLLQNTKLDQKFQSVIKIWHICKIKHFRFSSNLT